MCEKNISVYALHKCASVFIGKIARDLSQKSNMEFCLHPEVSYQEFIKERNACLAPIRIYSECPYQSDFRIIVHIRDPRDVLTSAFFRIVTAILGGRADLMFRIRKDMSY